MDGHTKAVTRGCKGWVAFELMAVCVPRKGITTVLEDTVHV